MLCAREWGWSKVAVESFELCCTKSAYSTVLKLKFLISGADDPKLLSGHHREKERCDSRWQVSMSNAEPVDNLIFLPSFAEIAFATTQMSRFVFWFQTRNRINRHALTCGTDQVSNCWHKGVLAIKSTTQQVSCESCIILGEKAMPTATCVGHLTEAMQTQQSTGLQSCTTSPNLVLLTKTSRLNSFTLCTSLAKQYDVLRSQSSLSSRSSVMFSSTIGSTTPVFRPCR